MSPLSSHLFGGSQFVEGHAEQAILYTCNGECLRVGDFRKDLVVDG
jgi:hypothetical protein